MTDTELLHYLESLNIRLRTSGANLRIRAPKGVITPEIENLMIKNKANLIAALKSKMMVTNRLYWNGLIHGDCFEHLKMIPDASVDLIITDPPYGLKIMGKNWDKAVPKVEIWRECLRLLKPGAFAFIMCSPRQDVLYRMISNIESAGFNIGFTSLYWTYATGLPKGLNISKAIDKRAGAERKIICQNPNSRKDYRKFYTINRGRNESKTAYFTEPETPEAKKFNGSYASYQPNPFVEIVLVAMKPITQPTYTEQVLENGKGITWMDNCRIPYEEHERKWDPDCNRNGQELGRFPANLVLSDKVLGSYSKFVNLDIWAELRLPFLIVPKASKKEKELGLEDTLAEIEGNKDRSHKTTRNTHPTVKPLKLMAYLIALGSKETEIVLDPYCGSGTTCVAASLLNRKFLGIEISAEYFNLATKRIRAATIRHHTIDAETN